MQSIFFSPFLFSKPESLSSLLIPGTAPQPFLNIFNFSSSVRSLVLLLQGGIKVSHQKRMKRLLGGGGVFTLYYVTVQSWVLFSGRFSSGVSDR